MKTVKFISDNTPESEPNILRIVQRDDGDIEMSISIKHRQERGISIRASGSRLRSNYKVIKLFSEIIDTINEEDKREEYKRINFDNINFSDEIIDMNEALKDIPPITYDRIKELLKYTIEVCGDKENSKYSSHYEDFIEELMERIGMTEEEYNELFEEDN